MVARSATRRPAGCRPGGAGCAGSASARGMPRARPPTARQLVRVEVLEGHVGHRLQGTGQQLGDRLAVGGGPRRRRRPAAGCATAGPDPAAPPRRAPLPRPAGRPRAVGRGPGGLTGRAAARRRRRPPRRPGRRWPGRAARCTSVTRHSQYSSGTPVRRGQSQRVGERRQRGQRHRHARGPQPPAERRRRRPPGPPRPARAGRRAHLHPLGSSRLTWHAPSAEGVGLGRPGHQVAVVGGLGQGASVVDHVARGPARSPRAPRAPRPS